MRGRTFAASVPAATAAAAAAAIAATIAVAIAAVIASAAPARAQEGLTGGAPRLVFATFAEDGQQVREAIILAESIRSFAGALKDAPIWLYKPEALALSKGEMACLARLDVEVKTSEAPAAALRFPLSAKVFAAAKAEACAACALPATAAGAAPILVWMDTDTVVWREPAAFLLPDGKNLGFRPVMLKNISSPWAGPPDAFWSRLYRTLGVCESALFPMTTTADGTGIRPQFNAGLLVVRPERGILRAWPEAFERLYTDTAFVGMCARDRLKAIFFHQAALAGSILSCVSREEMLDLAAGVNYPIFRHASMPPRARPQSLDDLVTLRYDVMLRSPGWRAKIPARAKVVDWLEKRASLTDACR